MQSKNVSIKVVIKNTNGIVFDDEIKALTSYNEKGLFDVLPLHENFISIIKDKIILHPLEGKRSEITIRKGVMEVSENNVKIYLGL